MNPGYILSSLALLCRFAMLPALVIFLSVAPKAFAATTTPLKNAGTGANVTGVGTVAWTNPGNVTAVDNSNAQVSVSGGAISNYLQATNFGFSIPPEATITAITVTIGRYENTTGTGTDVRDNVVRLIKSGALVGDNDASTFSDWPTSLTAATYNGSTNNLWNTSWTPADINASNFGVALAVNSSNSRTAYVDYIQISVTFSGTYLSSWISMNTGSSTWCAGETRTITVTLKNNGTNTWTDSWPDINIGVKWNADGDYNVRTDAGNLAPGATQTYSFSVTAPTAGSNNLTFDVVYEALTWFAGNGGGVGPGNVVYASPAITITNSVPAQPGSITGSTTPCLGTSQVYSVTNVTGVTYTWSFPAGWTQTGGGTANSVTATVGSGSGNVQVTPSNGCGNGTPGTLGVTVRTATATVTGHTNIICNGGNNGTISVLASDGTSPFTFSKDNGSNYVAGDFAASHTFTGLSANTAYKIRVKDNTGCESPLIP